MDRLRVGVSSVPERGRVISAVVPAEEVQPAKVEPLDVGPVTVEGALSKIGEDYVFRGRVSGTYLHACDRCLDEIEVPFASEVLWTFVHGTKHAAHGEHGHGEGDLLDVPSGCDAEAAEGEESGVALIQGNVIDLAGRVWEEVVLAVPSKFLCSEDCAGLCPQCGANLNIETCSCPRDEADDTRVNEDGASPPVGEDSRPENVAERAKGLASLRLKLGDLFPDLRPDQAED